MTKQTQFMFLKNVTHFATDCMPSFNPIMVQAYAAFFSCTAVPQASDSMTALTGSFNYLVEP